MFRNGRKFRVGVLLSLLLASTFVFAQPANVAARAERLFIEDIDAPRVDEMGVVRSGGICGTRHYEPHEIAAMEARDAALIDRDWVDVQWVGAKVIKVNFHVIVDGTAGLVTGARLRSQIDYLNAAFAGNDTSGVDAGSVTGTRANMDISFVWNNPKADGEPVTYNSRSWYKAQIGSSAERNMKTTIAALPGNDPHQVLNIYINSPRVYMGGTLLGWATFPWELAGDPLMDGVVMNNIAVFNSSNTSYNAGDVVAHEIGHWLGLFHTFQGGCTGTSQYDPADPAGSLGDVVVDTPPQASSSSGCPSNPWRDSCAGVAIDPIDNFMDYSSDSCQTKFSLGQKDRAAAKTTLYRGTM